MSVLLGRTFEMSRELLDFRLFRLFRETRTV
jgi:hypothetical protein